MAAKKPVDIKALVEKLRDGQAFTEEEAELAIAALQAKADAVSRTSGNAAPTDEPAPGDLVRFDMPPTVMGGAYHINGRPYVGSCTESYEVYHQLAIMFQNDLLAYRELFEKRVGQHDQPSYIQWIAPDLRCSVVKKLAVLEAEKAAKLEAKKAAEAEAHAAA